MMNQQSGGSPVMANSRPINLLELLAEPFHFLLWLFVSPMALWFRWWGWGSRSLRFMPIWIIAALVGYVVVFFFTPDFISLSPSVTPWLFMAWFTITMGLGARQWWMSWQRHRVGDFTSVASFDRGRSWDWWLDKVPYLEKEAAVMNWLEPGVSIVVGALLYWLVDPLFGGFIFLMAVGFLIKEWWDFSREWDHFLDLMDSQIEAVRMGEWMGWASAHKSRHRYSGNHFTRLMDATIDDQDVRQSIGAMKLGIPIQLQQLFNGHQNNGAAVPAESEEVPEDVEVVLEDEDAPAVT